MLQCLINKSYLTKESVSVPYIVFCNGMYQSVGLKTCKLDRKLSYLAGLVAIRPDDIGKYRILKVAFI